MALSRDQIVEAALVLIDAEGEGALSMRRLGRSLGVEAMSLYRYVGNKEGLLDVVHERLVAELPAPAPGPWPAALVHQAQSFRDVLAEHGGAVSLVATRAASTPLALRHVDGVLARLRAEGFAGDGALFALQTVFAFVVGHAMFHLAHPRRDTPAAREEFRWGLDVVVAGLASVRAQ